jgi:hypothetical protein
VTRHRIVLLTAAAATGVLLSGCLSIHNPDATNQPATRRSTASTATNPTPAPERGGTIPTAARRAQRQLAAGAGANTPIGALERYATVWSNWTAATVIARQRELAGMSLGQARAQAEQAIASLQHDQTLAKSQVANSGQVVAIAPSLHTPGEWVVVTSETTTGQGDYAGLPATLHVTYAHLTHTSRGYVISQWSPRL